MIEHVVEVGAKSRTNALAECESFLHAEIHAPGGGTEQEVAG